jgi:hypothetical protein
MIGGNDMFILFPKLIWLAISIYTYTNMPQRCQECKKGASFGLELKKPTHCKSHASSDMFNVKSKRCAHPGDSIA